MNSRRTATNAAEPLLLYLGLLTSKWKPASYNEEHWGFLQAGELSSMTASALGLRNELNHDFRSLCTTFRIMAATSPQDLRHAHNS
jgi:hypothetical protein